MKIGMKVITAIFDSEGKRMVMYKSHEDFTLRAANDVVRRLNATKPANLHIFECYDFETVKTIDMRALRYNNPRQVVLRRRQREEDDAQPWFTQRVECTPGCGPE